MTKIIDYNNVNININSTKDKKVVDPKTQQKLEKLEKIEQSRRERARRHLEKVRNEGKKQISAIVSGETYEEIIRRKEASQQTLTTGQVIDQAIMGSIDSSVETDVNINEPVKQAETPGPMPNPSDKDDYKAWLFNQISALKDSGLGWVEITNKFNSDGITTVSGTTWGRSAVYVFYNRNK